MLREIAPVTLDHLLRIGSTLALIDVREQGEYNEAHIPGASVLPRRLIEFRVRRLVPWQGVQVVVCDDNGRRAVLAAATLTRMGYVRVAALEGGINRWSSEGFPTEWGMNVPSKDFGEMVEVRYHVPTIEARELARRQRQGEEFLILDTRTPEEFQRFCIPGGRSLPNGELALRVADVIRQNPGRTVVVNCAGRTRSIIGSRLLQRMGIPAVGLRNGTSGWVLAGLELEQGAERVELPPPTPQGRGEAEAFARRTAAEDGVRLLDVEGLERLLAAAGSETTYAIDVRTEAEFSRGHIPGFWWFPGGQAVQRADDVIAVRNGAIIFACDDIVRAAVTASWFRQMGYPNVSAVDGGVTAWQASGRWLETGMAELEPFGLAAAATVPLREPQALQAALGREAPLTLFVGVSSEFARGHVPGSRWLSRSWLELQIGALARDTAAPIVITDEDDSGALLAAATLRELGYSDVSALAGGVRAWRAAGLPVEQGLTGVMRPPDDVVVMGPDRGTADMIHYLRWEEELGRKYATQP